MAEKLKARFFSLEYRLSPENKYPDSLDDALFAYEWLEKNGYTSDKISVCGDSAGAHLAASLVHKLIADNSDRLPDSQFLIYPMCDPSCKSESYDDLAEGYLLTKKTMIWFWEKFGKSEQNIKDGNQNHRNQKKIRFWHIRAIYSSFSSACTWAAPLPCAGTRSLNKDARR